MAKILGYNRWENFQNVIPKAKAACANSGHKISDHFRDITKMVKLGSRAKREVEDLELSRYACYLIVQNADPSKEIVALGQTYFAVQTRRQELTDELTTMSEDQLRLVRRTQMSILNNQLAGAAQGAGVIEPRDFAIFQDHGYMGLYGKPKARRFSTMRDRELSGEFCDVFSLMRDNRVRPQNPAYARI